MQGEKSSGRVSVGAESDIFSATYYRGISQNTTGIHVLHESQLRATLYGATLLMRASKKVVSGSVVYPETAGQNRWSYRATSYMWRRVDLCFLPSHKPWEQRFSFLSPSKFLKPCERRRSQALCVDVCFVMLCEVVTPHETFLTLIALKAFVSWKQTKKEENLNPDASHLYLVHVCIWSLHTCVCPGVSLQLVTACESFSAEDPAAHKGSLSRVQSDMSPEQGSLSKGLFTACYVADVFSFPHLSWPAACKNQLHWVFHLKPLIYTEQNPNQFAASPFKFNQYRYLWEKINPWYL